MISIQHLYKTYPGPVHALRDVNLHIEKGEFVFLTGPSGSGKTTLFKMLSAYDRPTSGSLIVNGFDLSGKNIEDVHLLRRRIGIVFQDYRLLKDRSIFDNISLPLQIRNETERMISRKVHEVLVQVGLDGKEDYLPETLSGGEQQRAAIARAIIHQPNLLIADEPTGNLDPDLANDIMDLFEKVAAQGTTVVIASHDIEMVKRRNKRTLTLIRGILSDGILDTKHAGYDLENFTPGSR